LSQNVGKLTWQFTPKYPDTQLQVNPSAELSGTQFPLFWHVLALQFVDCGR